MVTYIVIIVAIAFLFDFSNGFHDSANSIATIVGTRVLPPLAAVAWAALFNFSAVFIAGTAVAKTVQSGMIDQSIVDPTVILAALLGAITWNIITWGFGLPSSSSHALIGGYAGAAVAKAGWVAILWGPKWQQMLVFIVLSPMIGLAAGFVLMVAVYWIFQRVSPARVEGTFRVAQIASSALFSFSHGANDAQKTMGIIVGLLGASQTQAALASYHGPFKFMHMTQTTGVPLWVEIGAYSAIALGTLFGGWRIVHTMGSRITKLRPVGGFCAEAGGSVAILTATHFGIPVSTTHNITGAIVGVGSTTRLTAVRWGVAGRIVWAWLLTIPAAMIVAAAAFWVLQKLGL